MNLITKYNVPVPRYTSFPTVPFWKNIPSQEQWKELVRNSFKATNAESGISLYIHLPFCESLCTYCACNTRITVNHKVEKPYLQAVLNEWKLYTSLLPERPRIRELHLGGGTPTFFSPENLQILISGILEPADICENHDFSFEGHPANTTAEHLRTLYDLGFRRVSFGIQDFDPIVQDVINRYQSVEQVAEAVQHARAIGYKSVNFDLVYGLPHQSLATITDTIEKVICLRPDRIAFYSYAHVPWLRPGQRKFTEKDLPVDVEKRKLYEKALQMFQNAGYNDVGMDHFALPGDPLFMAAKNKTMHRNFMGYTTHHTELMIGLGASAIGDTWTAFAQNIRAVEAYQKAVSEGRFPIMKGHVLDEEEKAVRSIILDLMCRGEMRRDHHNKTLKSVQDGFTNCKPLEDDKLLKIENDVIRVTELGKSFLRNICSCFDKNAVPENTAGPVFSAAV